VVDLLKLKPNQHSFFEGTDTDALEIDIFHGRPFPDYVSIN